MINPAQVVERLKGSEQVETANDEETSSWWRGMMPIQGVSTVGIKGGWVGAYTLNGFASSRKSLSHSLHTVILSSTICVIYDIEQFVVKYKASKTELGKSCTILIAQELYIRSF